MKSIRQLEKQIRILSDKGEATRVQLSEDMAITDPDNIDQLRGAWTDLKLIEGMLNAKATRVMELRAKVVKKSIRSAGYQFINEELPHATRNALIEKDGKRYVVKTPRFNDVTGDYGSLADEIQTMLSLDHPNIIKPAEYCLDTPYVITPFYEGGTMAEANFDSWSEEEQQAYQKSIDNARDYTRSKGFDPKDISGKNVFLKADGRTPVIGDLEGWKQIDQPMKEQEEGVIS